MAALIAASLGSDETVQDFLRYQQAARTLADDLVTDLLDGGVPPYPAALALVSTGFRLAAQSIGLDAARSLLTEAETLYSLNDTASGA